MAPASVAKGLPGLNGSEATKPPRRRFHFRLVLIQVGNNKPYQSGVIAESVGPGDSAEGNPRMYRHRLMMWVLSSAIFRTLCHHAV
jgi:hypothetical protein